MTIQEQLDRARTREFLTADQVALLFQYNPRSILRLARAGKIPGAVRFGRCWRFRRTVVSNWGKMTLSDISRLVDS